VGKTLWTQLSAALIDVPDDNQPIARASECRHDLVGDSDGFGVCIASTFDACHGRDARGQVIVQTMDGKRLLAAETVSMDRGQGLTSDALDLLPAG
jgi:hypothetical protein